MSEEKMEVIRKILVKANNTVWDMPNRHECINTLQEICETIIKEFNFQEFAIGEDYIEED